MEYYQDYEQYQDMINVNLLDSSLSSANPYMQIWTITDNSTFASVEVDNYILGDTHDYKMVEGLNHYNCESGEVYHSSVSLKIDMVLSGATQDEIYETEYLGYYEYETSYVSKKGYRVNLIEEKLHFDGAIPDDYVSEKAAVFVADGICYQIKGRVSWEVLKDIVDSME